MARCKCGGRTGNPPDDSFPHVLTASHIRGTNFRLDLSHSFIGEIQISGMGADADAARPAAGGVLPPPSLPSPVSCCQRACPNSPGSILESRFRVAAVPPRAGAGASCSPLIMEFNVNSITRPALGRGRGKRKGRKRYANEERIGEEKSPSF